MTTPENNDPTAPADPQPHIVRPPEGPQTSANRGPDTGTTTGKAGKGEEAHQPHQTGVRDPDVLAVNEAVASTVRTAYDVLSDTIAQGRKAAEQFRVGAYNVRDVPEDLRHMAGNLLGLARQLSSTTFDICEALLRQADGVMTPPPPGSTHVAPFQTPKGEQAAPKPAAAHAPAPAPAPAAAAAPAHASAPAHAPATAPASEIHLTVTFEGHDSARAHTTTISRPKTPTGTEQFACDGLTQRGGSAAPITAVAFDAHPNGRGMVATVYVPPEHPKGVYVGAVYCATQDLPLGQLVIEIE